jgi:hypothetical protein
MEVTRQRRYAVMGDGIIAHGTSLDEAISLFRQRSSGEDSALQVGASLESPDEEPVSAD